MSNFDYPEHSPGQLKEFRESDAHKEMVVQEHLVHQLVTTQGYRRRDSSLHYDRRSAMDRELVLEFLKSTQSEAWKKLEDHYNASAESTLFTQLEKALKSRGLLDVFRQGIKIVPGIKFSLCYFRPASALEPNRVKEFEANILSVSDEVEYSIKNGNRIDAVLFLNGLPVVTIEAKNVMTGTTFRHAERQYRKDRRPAGEPLLAFKRGALVHFALDQDNVSMATRLANGKTRFLPFNRGRDGGAGNSDVDGEFRIAHLYADGGWGKAVFSRTVLIGIIGQFLHVEKTPRGEALIFPRYQQLDAVTQLAKHAREFGPGQNYLIQHSAGSGKSKTIGWLAHHAINLHTNSDEPIFNTAIVVTDRIILDSQLQKTVSQLEQTPGVVKKIDGTSRQLKAAIQSGARIVVTTIQKFSTEHLKEISGQGSKTFAVIVDEAHSSQSGKTSQAMTDALTREASTSDDIEDIILEYQKARGPQSNVSFFAFTATPRNVTLERFGVSGSDGLPEPFHLYSMRQAIEEGFILDVLQNYMTYKAYYKLEKAIADDPELSGRKAQARVAKYAALHPTAIGQKVEIIVEHFRRHVMSELDGQAKAMIVTQSREHALRYYLGLKAYIENEKYNELQALVAFSGELDIDGVVYTEAETNGFSEKELPSRFDGFRPDGTPYDETYQLLIVAEKYQTGFDQPKLCAMYVDRKLAGLQAVQTLSRLNRTRAGKDKTYVLDFRNSVDDIQTAFKPFFELTSVEALSDPNQIYDLEGRLYKFGYLDQAEIERFAQTYFRGRLTTTDRARLEGLVREAVARVEIDDDEGRQEEFRQLLKSFNRFYSFVAQIVRLDDSGLEKLAAYGSWLARLLPNRELPPEIELTEDMLRLQAFRIEQKENGDASLPVGAREPLKAINEFGAKPYSEDEQKELSEIVKAFNDRHGTEFTDSDFLRYEPTYQETMNENMVEMLKNNSPDVVYSAFSQAFFQSAIRSFQRDNDMRDIVLTDADARDKMIRFFFNRAIRDARDAA